MRFDVDVGQASHAGPKARNEDHAAVAWPPGHEPARGLVAAIADGVSGGGAGQEAAQTTVRAVVQDFHSTPETWHTSVALDRLIGAQNTWLADHNRRRQGGAQSATGTTTFTCLVLRGEAWTVAHVGDTRAWLLRDGQCHLLTQDHAYGEEFQRSRLTRAIGLDDLVRIDFTQGQLRRGDVFALTTDGVHNVLPRTRIAALAASGDAACASQALVDAAVRAGTTDNATALVVQVRQLIAGSFDDALLPGRDLLPPPRLQAGSQLDRWAIDSLLEDNDRHHLYRAHGLADGAQVVIKALQARHGDDPLARAMLLHEAWLAHRVAERSPPPGEAGFVSAHDTADASALYTVHDWHAGANLDQLLAQGRQFAVGEIVDAGLAIARALARLHRHGVIHRDIKPANLHLGHDGRWRVLDLGAALSGHDSNGGSPGDLPRAGSPSYMNPEQWGIAGQAPTPADAASDVYALGATLYQWLSTKLPYGEVLPYQLGRFRRDPKPPSRLRPDVPIWLDHIVLKAVALERKQRFDTAEELVLALERAALRPLGAPQATPLLARDPVALWKAALAMSLLFNALLVVWLLFLPR